MIGVISATVQAGEPRAVKGQLRTALVRSLLADVDPSSSLLGSTLAFVDERLARLGGVARFVVLGVERVLSAGFALATVRPRVQPSRRDALVRRLDATRLPVVADYVRVVRSLVLIFAYETRPPAVENPSWR